MMETVFCPVYTVLKPKNCQHFQSLKERLLKKFSFSFPGGIFDVMKQEGCEEEEVLGRGGGGSGIDGWGQRRRERMQCRIGL